jgi:hypothetical protein
MTSQPDEPSFSESHLESPEYRERLQRKLNCLIAVLEVACAKVRRSLTGKDADVERLTRIQKNLQDTLNVCRRAKRALERREGLPTELPAALDLATDPAPVRRESRPPHSFIEMSTPEEMEKFEGMGPIEAAELEAVDFDDLTRLLQGGDDE